VFLRKTQCLRNIIIINNKKILKCLLVKTQKSNLTLDLGLKNYNGHFAIDSIAKKIQKQDKQENKNLKSKCNKIL